MKKSVIKNIRKNHLLKTVLVVMSSLFLLWSCTTTDVVDENQKDNTEITEAPKPKDEKKKTEKENEEPANIVFAKKIQAALDKGDVKGAIDLYQNIPAELSSDIDFKLILASLYVSDGQYEKASSVADAVLALDNGNISALEIKTLCARVTQDTSTYKALSKQILAVDPYNVQANIMEGDDQALNHKWKLARDAYKKALKTDSTNEDALYGYAKMTYYMDDIDTAEEYCQKVLDKNAQNSEALALMGKLAAEDFNYVRAIKFTEDALVYDPDNYDFYMDMGTYYRYQGNYTEAVKCWEKAVTIDPEYFLGYAYLAGIYDEQNKFDLALSNYRKVIETNPDYYYAYESTAILEYHFGNYDEARQLFDKAYSYSKDYCYKLMNMAMYLKEGNTFAAKNIMNETLKTLDRDSLEYSMVRMYADNYSRNAETSLINKINKEDNSNKRGKMLFYMGLFFEINGSQEMANEYYAKVTNMQAPMFFEYRLAEWGLGL